MSATPAKTRIDVQTNSVRSAANAPDPEAKCKLISHPNFTNELVMRGAGFYSNPDGHNEGERFVSNDAFEKELKQALEKCAGMAKWSFANLTPAYNSVWEFEIHATFQLMQHECIQDALVSVGAPKKIICPFKMDLGNGRHWGDREEDRGEVEVDLVKASPAQTTSRRSKRHAKHTPREGTPVSDAPEDAQDGVKALKNNKRRKSTVEPMTAARTIPLLICSVGNPGSSYANTLHSAGHTVVNRLAEHLGYSGLRKDRELGNGLVARPPSSGGAGDWTLWQSTSYMNESGKGVKAAFTSWAKHMPAGEEGRLVVVHDELEKPLGAVTLKLTQGASAKGHNGLKSIMSVIRDTPFVRIGIGIGRPESRSPDDVARFVLKKMTPAEKAKIEGGIEDVIAKLRQLEKG
ncbi:hypothetical protein LTR17_009343 [Elasticomyces elasticus]|nr:hypothetical protein LTR17_009343 [Elasticomyces elasticus]